MQISSLAALCFERRAWKDVESIARGYRDKKLHAFAMKRISELGLMIADKGRDEMENEDESNDDDDPMETSFL